MDPANMRKIKDNLRNGERDALKDIIENFPKMNLRIRREDKGGRFCIVDGETEDMLIEQDLSDPIQYREIPENSTDDTKNRIKQWADTNLEDGNITNNMHNFVTKDLDKSHPAHPKPLMKTHKVDANGETIKPCPIRKITAACGTPEANLSKGLSPFRRRF